MNPNANNDEREGMMALLRRVLERFPDVANPQPQAPIATRISLSWNDMPMMDPSKGATLDNWFVTFESRMKAARIPEDHWAGKLEECPKVPESVKAKIRQMTDVTTYAAIRRKLLEELGPLQPAAFFRRELFRIRGTNREDVRARLEEMKLLHDRAALDSEPPAQVITEPELMYAFCSAFPDEIAARLEKNMAILMTHTHPFEALFRQAPSEDQAVTKLAAIQEEPGAKRARAEGEEETPSTTRDLVCAIISELRRDRDRPPQGRNQNKGACPRCARRNCPQGQACPAMGATCHKCGKSNHWGPACRGRPQHNDRQDRTEQRREQRNFRSAPPSEAKG